MGNKFAYIIPLHKEDKKVFRAIESIPDGATIIVATTTEVEGFVCDGFTDTIKAQVVVAKDGCSSYPALVNAGINYLKKLSSEINFINILEFDDTVINKAHKIVDEYSNDWKDVEVFAPLACVIRENEDKNEKPALIGIANEAAMAAQIAEEHGIFDFNMILRTNFVFVNGCYIKPSVFDDYGLFKENFELFYDYEWVLRVIYNGGIIRSIPKATHFHALTDDSASEAQKALPRETHENWLGAARREYFFEIDREISFE